MISIGVPKLSLLNLGWYEVPFELFFSTYSISFVCGDCVIVPLTLSVGVLSLYTLLSTVISLLGETSKLAPSCLSVIWSFTDTGVPKSFPLNLGW